MSECSASADKKKTALLRAERFVKRNQECLKRTKRRVHESYLVVLAASTVNSITNRVIVTYRYSPQSFGRAVLKHAKTSQLRIGSPEQQSQSNGQKGN